MIVVRSSVQAIIMLLFRNLATTCNVYSVSCCMYLLRIYTNRTVASEIQTADCPACAVTISMVRTDCPKSPLPSSCACIEIIHNIYALMQILWIL